MNSLKFEKPQILKEESQLEISENDSCDEKIMSMEFYNRKNDHKFIDGNNSLFKNQVKKTKKHFNEKHNIGFEMKNNSYMKKQMQRCSSLEILKRKIIQESKLNCNNIRAKKKQILINSNQRKKTYPNIIKKKEPICLKQKDNNPVISGKNFTCSKEKEKEKEKDKKLHGIENYKNEELRQTLRETLRDTISSEDKKINYNSSSNMKENKIKNKEFYLKEFLSNQEIQAKNKIKYENNYLRQIKISEFAKTFIPKINDLSKKISLRNNNSHHIDIFQRLFNSKVNLNANDQISYKFNSIKKLYQTHEECLLKKEELSLYNSSIKNQNDSKKNLELIPKFNNFKNVKIVENQNIKAITKRKKKFIKDFYSINTKESITSYQEFVDTLINLKFMSKPIDSNKEIKMKQLWNILGGNLNNIIESKVLIYILQVILRINDQLPVKKQSESNFTSKKTSDTNYNKCISNLKIFNENRTIVLNPNSVKLIQKYFEEFYKEKIKNELNITEIESTKKKHKNRNSNENITKSFNLTIAPGKRSFTPQKFSPGKHQKKMIQQNLSNNSKKIIYTKTNIKGSMISEKSHTKIRKFSKNNGGKISIQDNFGNACINFQSKPNLTNRKLNMNKNDISKMINSTKNELSKKGKALMKVLNQVLSSHSVKQNQEVKYVDKKNMENKNLQMDKLKSMSIEKLNSINKDVSENIVEKKTFKATENELLNPILNSKDKIIPEVPLLSQKMSESEKKKEKVKTLSNPKSNQNSISENNLSEENPLYAEFRFSTQENEDIKSSCHQESFHLQAESISKNDSKDSNPIPIMLADVNLDGNTYDRIIVYRNDDPRDLALKFGITHSKIK